MSKDPTTDFGALASEVQADPVAGKVAQSRLVEIMSADDEPDWSFDKPKQFGGYWLSLAPDKRKRFAPVCEASMDGTGEVWIGDSVVCEERLVGAQWAVRNRPADPFVSPTPIHACPPEGSGIMPCCGRTPFEKMRDRITNDHRLVTCGRK